MAKDPKLVGQLSYDAERELLQVAIPGIRTYSMRAFSGGSRGHKDKVTVKQAHDYLHAEATSLKSRFSNTPEIVTTKKKYVQRGGVLLSGTYTCVYQKNLHGFGECIQLVPSKDINNRVIFSPFASHALAHHRNVNSFLIHGSGPKGSDGCIVPQSEKARRDLNSQVKSIIHRGGQVLLRVSSPYLLPAERFDGIGA